MRTRAIDLRTSLLRTRSHKIRHQQGNELSVGFLLKGYDYHAVQMLCSQRSLLLIPHNDTPGRAHQDRVGGPNKCAALPIYSLNCTLALAIGFHFVPKCAISCMYAQDLAKLFARPTIIEMVVRYWKANNSIQRNNVMENDEKK